MEASGVSLTMQIVLAILGTVSTSLLGILVFMALRFVSNLDKLAENHGMMVAENGRTLVVIERHNEQIKTLFSNSVRHEENIDRIEDHLRTSPEKVLPRRRSN